MLTDWAAEKSTRLSDLQYDAPPTIACSMPPSRSARAAIARACSDEAQAASTTRYGPSSPIASRTICAAPSAARSNFWPGRRPGWSRRTAAVISAATASASAPSTSRAASTSESQAAVPSIAVE